MKVISEEALRRFKRVDPDEIIQDAKKRLSQTSEEEQQKLQALLATYPDPDDLYCRLEELISFIEDAIEYHRQYLTEHNEVDFSERKIQQHNKLIDEISLSLVFLADKIAKFPPLPVLPPPAPLIKVSGIIEEVEFTKAMACFDAEVYSTVRDELERKRQRDNIGALVAMTAQVLSGAPPHAMIQDGRLKKQKCLYVKGKIDGKVFSGWFGMTNIRPGDRVEMAVMPEGDGYLAYAIANPEQRTISFTPKCNSGKESVTWKLSFFVCFILASLFYIPALIISPELWIESSFVCFLFCSLLGKLIQYREIKEKKPFMLLFNKISSTLSIEEYKKRNIYSFTKEKINELKKENKWLSRELDPLGLPQRGVDYHEEYFYYY